MGHDHLREPHVVLIGLVVGAGVDVGLDVAAEVGDLLGTLVHEHGHNVDVGFGFGNGVGELFEDGGLARLGRRDDQATGSLADGRDQVDDAHGHVAAVGQVQALVRADHGQVAHGCATREVGGGETANLQDSVHHETVAALLEGAGNHGAFDQPVASGQFAGNGDDRLPGAEILLGIAQHETGLLVLLEDTSDGIGHGVGFSVT